MTVIFYIVTRFVITGGLVGPLESYHGEVIRQTGCSFGESLGGLGLILMQFWGVLGRVGIYFNAVFGSPWVDWD